MPQNRRLFTPSFPDIKTAPGGRWGGALMGLQTMTERGDVERKFGQAEKLLGVRQQASKTRTSIAEMKNLVSLYNKQADMMNRRNIERMKINQNLFEGEVPEEMEKMPSFKEFTASITGETVDTGADIGGGAGLMGEDTFPTAPGPYGDATREELEAMGVIQPAQPARPAGASPFGRSLNPLMMGGRMGQDVGTQLQRLLGSPQAGADTTRQAPTAGQSPTTDDLIAALDDYDNADDAIEELVALDDSYDEAGLYLGENIDNDMFLEAFREKFGDEAVRRLQARVM